METKETPKTTEESKAPVGEESKDKHKVELRLKEKIQLEKTTAAWLKAHTELDINSNAVLRVASQVFAALKDELQKPGMTLEKVMSNCDRCPCATHEALKRAAQMLKDRVIGDA